MGEVYRARDTRLQRDVAVKVLPERLADNSQALARFEREARVVAALSHPNILAIHDVGREGQTAYAVMELRRGRDAPRRAPRRSAEPAHRGRVCRPGRARPRGGPREGRGAPGPQA